MLSELGAAFGVRVHAAPLAVLNWADKPANIFSNLRTVFGVFG